MCIASKMNMQLPGEELPGHILALGPLQGNCAGYVSAEAQQSVRASLRSHAATFTICSLHLQNGPSILR